MKRSIGWLLALGVAAGVGSIVALAVAPEPWPRAAYGIRGAAAATFLALAALSWNRYREGRDPRDLLTGTAALILAVGCAVFGIGGEHLPRLLSPDNGEGAVLPTEPVAVYAQQAGWLVAAICVLLMSPFRDRRGRAPLRPRRVIGLAVGAVAAIDGALVAASDSYYPGRPAPFPHHVTLDMPATRIWLAVATIAVLIGVVARAPVALHGRHRSQWAATAALCSIPIQLGFIAWPLQDLGWFHWTEVLPLAVAASLGAGMLFSQRAETSRMRRETDRAQLMMGGRAEIASMIAHELRGPVTTVRGLATTASTHYDSITDAERLEFFQLVDQESRRLLHIVDETSMALKVDAATLTYDIRVEDLGRIVTDAIAKAATGDHPVQADIAPDVALPLDRLRFQETLIQLLENAAKFSPPQAPIEVALHATDATVTVTVRDHGPGIDPPNREKAFDRFAKFRPRGYEEVPGPGLGLFIARSHVVRFRGEMVIEDAAGGGTMLRIDLPREGMSGS